MDHGASANNIWMIGADQSVSIKPELEICIV
jgi:hypothetical protein